MIIEIVKEEIELYDLIIRYANTVNPPLTARNIDLHDWVRKIYSFGKTFKAVKDSTVLGFISLYANDFENSIAYITFLSVDVQFRSLGIGRKLIEFSENYVRTLGINNYKLEVHKNNIKAIRFYEKNGFQIIGDKDKGSYYMVKELN